MAVLDGSICILEEEEEAERWGEYHRSITSWAGREPTRTKVAVWWIKRRKRMGMAAEIGCWKLGREAGLEDGCRLFGRFIVVF